MMEMIVEMVAQVANPVSETLRTLAGCTIDPSELPATATRRWAALESVLR